MSYHLISSAALAKVAELTLIKSQDSYSCAAVKLTSGNILTVVTVALAAIEIPIRSTLCMLTLPLRCICPHTFTNMTQVTVAATVELLKIVKAFGQTNPKIEPQLPGSTETPLTWLSQLRNKVAEVKKLATQNPKLVAGTVVLVSATIMLYFYGPSLFSSREITSAAKQTIEVTPKPTPIPFSKQCPSHLETPLDPKSMDQRIKSTTLFTPQDTPAQPPLSRQHRLNGIPSATKPTSSVDLPASQQGICPLKMVQQNTTKSIRPTISSRKTTDPIGKQVNPSPTPEQLPHASPLNKLNIYNLKKCPIANTPINRLKQAISVDKEVWGETELQEETAKHINILSDIPKYFGILASCILIKVISSRLFNSNTLTVSASTQTNRFPINNKHFKLGRYNSMYRQLDRSSRKELARYLTRPDPLMTLRDRLTLEDRVDLLRFLNSAAAA